MAFGKMRQDMPCFFGDSIKLTPILAPGMFGSASIEVRDGATGELVTCFSLPGDRWPGVDAACKAFNDEMARRTSRSAESRAQALVTAIAMAIVLPFWGCVVAHCSGVL